MGCNHPEGQMSIPPLRQKKIKCFASAASMLIVLQIRRLFKEAWYAAVCVRAEVPIAMPLTHTWKCKLGPHFYKHRAPSRTSRCQQRRACAVAHNTSKSQQLQVHHGAERVMLKAYLSSNAGSCAHESCRDVTRAWRLWQIGLKLDTRVKNDPEKGP